MKIKPLSCLLLGMIGAACTNGYSAPADSSTPKDVPPHKPMAVYFEGYEKLVLDDEFIWGTDAYIETFFGAPDFNRLNDYSVLLVGKRTAAKPLTEEETNALAKWVSDGGTLMLFYNELRTLWNNTPPEWVAGEGASAGWAKSLRVFAVQSKDHPLTRGLIGLGEKEGPYGEKSAWEGEAALGNFSTGENLVGEGKESILFVNPFGKGQVIVFGDPFMPPPPTVQDEKITLNMTPLAWQFWRNLISYLKLPTRKQAIADWAKTSGRKEALVTWYASGVGEKPLGGKTHNPPYPMAKDELKEMRFDMGIGERMRRDFFVTTLRDFSELSLEPTDLTDSKGNKISAANFRIYIQDKPRPDYPKASYYLVDPKFVEPVGSKGVKLSADDTITYWVAFATGDASEGDYTGAIEFKNGGEKVASLPVHVKVWPFHNPDPEVFHFEMEHDLFTLPPGNWMNPQLYNPDLLAKYQRALADLEVDVGQTTGGMKQGYYNKYVRLRSDGRPIDQALAESPELFASDSMPSLSFSGPFDVMWDNAIQAGISSFSQSWDMNAEISLYMARTALKNDKLDVNSPEHVRFIKWYWGEYNKYLKERGLRETYIKVGDEFGPEGIPHYIQSAAPMQAAGFKTYTTTYNLLQYPEAVAQMNPYTDMWQVSAPLRNPRDIFLEKKIPFDPKHEIWLTASCSWWGSFYGYARAQGMMTVWLKMEGLHLHGFMRWHQNESEGALPGPEGPFNSAGITNWGQSITEGRYLAQLYRMVDLAKKLNRGAKEAEEIKKEIDTQLIGLMQPGKPAPLIPLMPLSESNIGGEAVVNVAPYAMTWDSSNVAKLKVFDMMTRLKKAMGDIKPDLVFREIPLVKEGQPVCAIASVGSEKPAQALAAQFEKLSGAMPSIATDMDERPSAPTQVLIGTLDSNPALAAFVKKELPTEITPIYPPAGTYAIRSLPATKTHPAVIVVVGGDAKGVEIGAENLGRLVAVRNRW